MDKLVSQLKYKLKVSLPQRQIQLLTLAPESWSIKRTAEEFGVTMYKVNKARELKKEKGLLRDLKPKVGKTLSNDVEVKVKTFYEEDEHSHLLPGAKEFKSVKGPDGQRKHIQKRLLLLNLNELYQNYKRKYPNDKISLSKFCSLRPQHCITVGCRGTHSVCVCKIHQNVKLMLNALPTDHHLS